MRITQQEARASEGGRYRYGKRRCVRGGMMNHSAFTCGHCRSGFVSSLPSQRGNPAHAIPAAAGIGLRRAGRAFHCMARGGSSVRTLVYGVGEGHGFQPRVLHCVPFPTLCLEDLKCDRRVGRVQPVEVHCVEVHCVEVRCHALVAPHLYFVQAVLALFAKGKAAGGKTLLHSCWCPKRQKQW